MTVKLVCCQLFLLLLFGFVIISVLESRKYCGDGFYITFPCSIHKCIVVICYVPQCIGNNLSNINQNKILKKKTLNTVLKSVTN